MHSMITILKEKKYSFILAEKLIDSKSGQYGVHYLMTPSTNSQHSLLMKVIISQYI